MSFTFKQFNEFLSTDLDEETQLDEIWPFRNAEEKAEGERRKLELMARKGDLKAKAKLADMDRTKKIEKAHADRKSADMDDRFNAARDRAEITNRGQGKPRWNAQTKKWEDGDVWAHVGKHS